MIIEQHYDDEVLIGLLNEAEEDSHVPACDTCAGTLDSYRDLSSALNDQSVWDEREVSEAPSPKTTNFLRSFAERTRLEDATARPIVAKLIADPTLIEQHPEWRTAGVVRGLLKAVDENYYSDPKIAAEASSLSVKVAGSLEAGVYTRDVVTTLRAKACRAHADMLYFVGSYRESILALDAMESILGECSVSEHDEARANLLRAQVYNEIERFDEAIDLAARARRVFAAFGESLRVTFADASKAVSLMYARRFAEAWETWKDLLADSQIDNKTRAFYIHNAAVCQYELGEFGAAKTLFVQAVSEFERLGLSTMRARARWHLGRVLLAEQQYKPSVALLTEVREEFEHLGLPQDVALTSVDSAECLLMLDRHTEVTELCQAAMQYFAVAGLEYTQGALTALAYLKEAAAAKTLTVQGVGQVRAYFELLPKQPHLLFAFPL